MPVALRDPPERSPEILIRFRSLRPLVFGGAAEYVFGPFFVPEKNSDTRLPEFFSGPETLGNQEVRRRFMGVGWSVRGPGARRPGARADPVGPGAMDDETGIGFVVRTVKLGFGVPAPAAFIPARFLGRAHVGAQESVRG